VKSSWIRIRSNELDRAKLHITQTRTMRSKTKACITKSCKICALLRYYAAQSGNSLLTFWDNLSAPYSRIKKSKRENRAWLKLTDAIFFFGTSSTMQFFKPTCFRSQLCFRFQVKKHLTWWTLRLSYSQSLGTTEEVSCQDMHLRTNLVQG